jgi:two-component system chemotaxis response regulator CheB
VIAVVLSGSRDDGAVGAASVVAGGGVVVVQRPEDALNASMPQAVLDRVEPVLVADAAGLGELIGRLTREEVPDRRPAGPEVAIDAFFPMTTDEIVDQPPVYGCPSCGDGLFELENWPQPRYRYRVGHAWSPEGLIGEQAVATEGALWTALRALEEKSALSRRMAEHERPDRGWFTGVADDAEAAGRLIRELITRLGASTAAAQAE